MNKLKLTNHLYKKQLTFRSDKKKLQEKPHLTLDNMLIKKQFSLFTPGVAAERSSILNSANMMEGEGALNANKNVE